MLEICNINSARKLGLVFLDAQKAFDNVDWNFMKKQLDAIECGPKFKRIIDNIYKRQWAKIKINCDMTKKITIEQGTRQGCPLSPLLFILSLEILNTKIREDIYNKRQIYKIDKIDRQIKDRYIIKEDIYTIKSVKVQKEDYKLQAYVDDIVFILEDPNKSLETLMES